MTHTDQKYFIRNSGLLISNIGCTFSFCKSKKSDKNSKLMSMYEVTEKFNGGQNGYADRRETFNAAAIFLNVDTE